jgi:hypothetical protein
MPITASDLKIAAASEVSLAALLAGSFGIA